MDHVIQLPAQFYGWGCKLACMQHQDGRYTLIAEKAYINIIAQIFLSPLDASMVMFIC